MDALVLQHLRGVSRTYAILIPMLPSELGQAVGLAYLLMRIVDTLEDAPQLSSAQRCASLESLDRLLAERRVAFEEVIRSPVGETESERALLRDAPNVLSGISALAPPYRDAIVTCARSMIQGVREILLRSRQRGLPYPALCDAAELRGYCYCVAGVVGAMLCRMMAHHLRLPALLRLLDLAVELGIGLQLVNILKDALKDSRQGRRYLPMAPTGSIRASEVYRAVLDEARKSLQTGAEFVLALPVAARELRSFCGLPIAWGAMTLARAERNAAQGKIGRGAIRSSMARFAKLAADDQALRRWFTRMLRGSQGGSPSIA